MGSREREYKESASSDSQADEHPVDDVIRRALKRGGEQGSSDIHNVLNTDVKTGKCRGKRSRTTSSPENSPDGGPEQTDSQKSKRAKPSVGVTPVSTPPVGVTIVEEGQHVRNPEMQRLLRGARYFDDEVEEAGKKCFRCGQRGHIQSECQNQPKRQPCALCAQFGHNKAQCPSLLCYKCQQRGHIARDCPYVGQFGTSSEAKAPKVCIRCGRGSCAAAGVADYHRAEGACSEKYLEQDLTLVRCYVCNRMGHLCCAEAPQDLAEPSCYNCGEEGHLGSDCWHDKPTQVVMERQRDERQDRDRSYRDRYDGRDSRVPDRELWGRDRWSQGGSSTHYSGATMAVGNGYASRVNAMQQRSLGGQSNASTPREHSSNRFYPGSEKGRQQTQSRFGRNDDDYYGGYQAPYTAPAARWRR